MTSLWNFISQAYPPKPKFVARDLPDLQEKVYIVTGANTGVGKELAQLLYSKNARVYIAARSEDKAVAAIKSIKAAEIKSVGDLKFLHLDLGDLTTIKKSAETFLSKEKKLHVLFNNAGVMNPAQGSKTAQGYELQLGTNNIGPFMFTQLLLPALKAAANAEPKGTVRVVWVSSSAAEAPFCPTGGVPINNLDYHDDKSAMHKYAVSKAGNYLHSTEFAKRYRCEGIVSVALNPGNLNSDLWRTQGAVMSRVLKSFVLHPPIYGAYTELFAGISPDVTMEKSGEWIAPWGRFMSIRKDLLISSKRKSEGGSGVAQDFWEWNQKQIAPYLQS